MSERYVNGLDTEEGKHHDNAASWRRQTGTPGIAHIGTGSRTCLKPGRFKWATLLPALLMWCAMGVSATATERPQARKESSLPTHYVKSRTLSHPLPMGVAGELKGELKYDTYFPINHNVQNELVLVDNVVNESSYVQGGSLIAYDMDGAELDRARIDFSLRTGFRGKVKDIFPSLESEISYIAFGSDTRVDGWIVQSTSDGEKNTMQQVPHELVSKFDFAHMPVNENGYWTDEVVLVKTNTKGTPQMTVHPDEVVVDFDGTANNEINFMSPDMTPTGSLIYSGDLGALLRNSSLPTDDPSKYWLEFINKTENHTPFGSSETLEENIMGLLSFFNPKSGGAFTPTDASNIIGFSHIDVGYWWTGFAFANPGETSANVKLIYFNNDGQVVEESETYTIAPKAKKVDIARNLGAPLNGEGEFNGYAIAISDQPIYGLELFGPMNHESMGGVRAQSGLTGALIKEFDRDIPRTPGVILPYVNSDSEHWTGIGFLNNFGNWQKYVIQALKSNGEVAGETTLDLNAGYKTAKLVRDLFPSLDTSEISHLAVFGSDDMTNQNSDFRQNYTPIVFGLTGNESHTQLVGVTPVSNAPMEARLLGLQNLTRDGVDSLGSLDQLVKEKTFISEDNDTIRINIKGMLKEIGKIDGVNIDNISLLSLELYDSEGNRVGILGGSGDFSDGNQYSRNAISEWKIDSRNVPYGDSQVVLRMDYSDQGVSHSADFDLGITYRNNAEQDYDVDALKGEGWSYEKSQSNLELLTELISTDDVKWQDGEHYSYDENLPYLQKLFDGVVGDGSFEAVKIWIEDIKGSPSYGNAGALHIERTDGQSSGYAESFFTSSEKTVEKWKQFYEVQNN